MMQTLIDVYILAGEHVKAVDLLLKQLAGVRKSQPEAYQYHADYADFLARIGRAYLGLKQWNEAEPHLRECATIREKTQPDDWDTFEARSLLGGSLLGQKKYAEAEPLLLAGYEGMKKQQATIPPQGKIRLTGAVERLVQLYEGMEKPDDAAKWQKELEAAKQPATPIAPQP